MDTATKKAGQSIAIALIASVPLLFRGLFFEKDFFVFAAIAFLWVALCVTLSGITLKWNSFTDIALTGLTLCYILSAVFSAASTYNAIFEAMKYVLYLLIYFVAKDAFHKEEYIRRAFTVIMYFLAINALISLLTAAGIINYPMAYSDSEIEKWLNGTVQYHNAFGVLMLAGYFMASSLNNYAFKSVSFALNGIASYLLMFGLILSYSRGAWILVPVLFVLLLIFAAHETKLRFFATGFATLIGVMGIISKFTAFVDAKNTVSATVTLAIGLVISMVLYYALHILFQKIGDKKWFKIGGISLLVLLILAAAAVVLFPAAFPFLPQQMATRLAGLNFGSETVKERFVFYGDAFRLYKDHNMLLGSGGGAWEFLYGMYQSYLYYSTQAHSYIMQVLTETGALGIVFWIALIVLFFVQCFKARKSSRMGKDLLCALTTAGTALILHSFIDFDLSIPAVMLILWCLLGILDGDSPLSFKGIILNKWAVFAVSLVLCICSVLGFVGCQNYETAKSVLAEKDSYAESLPYFQAAARTVPFNEEYQSALLLAREQTDEIVLSDEMKAITNKAKYNKTVFENAFYFFDAQSDYVNAFEALDSLVRLQPLNLSNYVSLASVSAKTIQQYMSLSDFKGALNTAKRVLEYKDKMIEASASTINEDAVKNTIEYAEMIKTALGGAE